MFVIVWRVLKFGLDVVVDLVVLVETVPGYVADNNTTVSTEEASHPSTSTGMIEGFVYMDKHGLDCNKVTYTG